MDPQKNGQPKKLPHIFIGIASHDHRAHVRFMMSLFALVGCGRYKLTLSNVSGGGIHKARNNLAWEFLTKTDAEWFMSLDTDIEFHPDFIAKLMAHNQGVVGAPYCHKKPELEWSARAIAGKGVDPATGLQELCAAGTGFLLIKREVFEKIRADHPEIEHIEDWVEGRNQKKWDFFSEGIVCDPPYYPQPTFLSEDFYFCKRARDAGFPIYLDTSFYVKHWDGSRGYPENPPVMQTAEQIKATQQTGELTFKRE